MPAKMSRPSTSNWPWGHSRRREAWLSGVVSEGASIRPPAVTATQVSTRRPMPESCQAGGRSVRSSAAASMAPAMPPTLKLPCKLPMMGRPARASSIEPSVLIATSYKLMAAPNRNMAGNRPQSPGHQRALPTESAIANAHTWTARRTPSHATMRPATSSEAMAPMAMVSNTSDKEPSLKPYVDLAEGMCTPHAPPVTPRATNWARVAQRALCRLSEVGVIDG